MNRLEVGCLGALGGLLIGVIATIAFFSIGVAQLQIETPIPAPERQQVTVSASAPFLNSQIQQAARQTNLVKQAVVTLDVPNIVQVSATVEATLLGQRVSTNATVRMRVTVQNGRIVLAVEKIDTGNPLIPQSFVANSVESLRGQAENQINAMVASALKGTSLRVTGVRITPGELAVDLTGQ